MTATDLPDTLALWTVESRSTGPLQLPQDLEPGETLGQLSTPGFTQVTLTASLPLLYSKSEDIEFIHAFRDSLKGAPLEARYVACGYFLP